MSKALLIVDYTYDFVADDGKLTAGKNAQAIEDSVSSAVFYALSEGAWIFICSDLHDHHDKLNPETALFPEHNMRGTTGRELYGKVSDSVVFVRNAHPELVFRIDKSRYSAFCGTKLDLLLRERSVDKLMIVGVCTDICIMHTAVDAYNLGYKLHIPENAVASFDAMSHEVALKHFKTALGANISPLEGRDI